MSRVLLIVGTYLICWILAYVLVNGDLNLKYIYEYFVAAWTFNGFVRPMYTWIVSVIIFFPTIGLISYLTRIKRGV